MDPQTAWIYPEFFQASRDYILHLQQIGILLISAISIVFFKSKNNKNPPFTFVAVLSFLLGVANLILGIYSYSTLLGTILDFSTKILPDLGKIRCLITIQFSLSIVILVLLLILVALYSDTRKKT